MKRLLTWTVLIVIYFLVYFLSREGSLKTDYQISEQVEQHDETRYITFAENLTKGYYISPKDPQLANGPGYPLFVAIFLALKLPIWVVRMMNIFFMLAGVRLLELALRKWCSPQIAFFVSIAMGLYPGLLKWIAYAHTESISFFLVCGFIKFFFDAIAQTSHKKLNTPLILAGLFLGYLVLVRTIFGYVIIAAFCIAGILWLIQRKHQYRLVAYTMVLAFVMAIPYLMYTYRHTGKVMYWSSGGGEFLYWISTPYDDEYGNWFALDNLNDYPGVNEKHGAFIDSVVTLNFLVRDSIMAARGIRQISQHPVKYALNVFTNITRFTLNYPYTETWQKPSSFVHMVPGMMLIFLMLFSLYLASINIKHIPLDLAIVLGIGLIYFGGSSLLPAVTRYFGLFIPFSLPWLCWIYSNCVKIVRL